MRPVGCGGLDRERCSPSSPPLTGGRPVIILSSLVEATRTVQKWGVLRNLIGIRHQKERRGAHPQSCTCLLGEAGRGRLAG